MDEKDNKNELIASQQNLFNLEEKSPENESNSHDIDIDNNAASFMQFDLFDQNMKMMNNNVGQERAQKYENKFENLNNFSTEIEPKGGLDISKLKEEKNITREKHYKKPKIQVSKSLIENPTLKDKDISSAPSPVDNINKKENNVIDIVEKTDDVSLSSASKEEKEVVISKKANDNVVAMMESDYKETIGKLYSASKHQDPYEANRMKSFKEIFPHSQVSYTKNDDNMSKLDKIIATNEDSNISCEDIKMLNNLYNLQGIKIKSHTSVSSKKSSKVYIDKNKLNMFSMLLTSFIMLIEVILTYIFVRNAGKIVSSHAIVYYLTGALSLALCIIAVLENFFDRYKLVIMKNNFKKEFTARLLIFIVITVVILAICLAFGMKSLGDKYFISLWLIPTLALSNIVVYFLVKYFFVKQKFFNS